MVFMFLFQTSLMTEVGFETGEVSIGQRRRATQSPLLCANWMRRCVRTVKQRQLNLMILGRRTESKWRIDNTTFRTRNVPTCKNVGTYIIIAYKYYIIIECLWVLWALNINLEEVKVFINDRSGVGNYFILSRVVLLKVILFVNIRTPNQTPSIFNKHDYLQM